MHEKTLEDSLPQSDPRRPTFYLGEQSHTDFFGTCGERAYACVGREDGRDRHTRGHRFGSACYPYVIPLCYPL